jgi:nitroimidazol reductase NimA-like FMN-containing flavoprotein (pyridoxamine 5'-phosphate oxidase superfamily)
MNQVMTSEPSAPPPNPAPIATTARFPAEYGQGKAVTPEHRSWDEVSSLIAASPNYWLATTTDDGRPYLRPVDGVFVGMTLAFGGSPQTRWVRNLQQRPEVSVSLPDDDHAVILEGRAELVTDADHPIGAAVRAANVAKYPQYYSGDDAATFQPFWAMRPDRVYAWSLSDFPHRATRFDLDPAG